MLKKQYVIAAAFTLCNNTYAANVGSSNNQSLLDAMPESESITKIGTLHIENCVGNSYGLAFDVTIGVRSSTQSEYESRSDKIVAQGDKIKELFLKEAEEQATQAYQTTKREKNPTFPIAKQFDQAILNLVTQQIGAGYFFRTTIREHQAACKPK